MSTPKLVLASTSKPRQMLLQRLQLPFTIAPSAVDETPLANEQPEALVQRLAVAKAKAVAANNHASLIIGADQVAVVEGKIFGKPHTLQTATEQLMAASGQRMKFYIGLCLLDTRDQSMQLALEEYDVIYRQLTLSMIENYLKQEQPLACAGSCQADGLGITLIEEFQGKDFTALIGLPLIRLNTMLQRCHSLLL
ncbi:MAG: nucleoside triphosphate pyrophosphatase [Pseudomonadota bacterium]